MKRLLMWCMFFFCLLSAAGCSSMKSKISQWMEGEKETGEQDTTETIGKVSDEEEKEKILVLVCGDKMMTGLASTVCDAIGAVSFPLSSAMDEEIKNAIKEAEYLLIGTDKEVLEWEFSLKKCLDEADIKEKRIALFLVGQTEKAKQYEDKLKKWYPEAVLLPTFTMEKEENLQEELGRMNGWLTTIMTYEMTHH